MIYHYEYSDKLHESKKSIQTEVNQNCVVIVLGFGEGREDGLRIEKIQRK